LLTYAGVNILLIIINLVTSPGRLWFYWVTIFWGIGIFLHASKVFILKDKFFGKEWEEKKIKEMMEKENNSKEKVKSATRAKQPVVSRNPKLYQTPEQDTESYA